MKRSSWTRTKMHGPAALMEKPTPAREMARKAASLGATRKMGSAGNGATKASAPEEITVHGRHPTLKTKREAVPKVPTKRRRLAIPKGNLEKEAGQENGGSHSSGGKVHARNVEPRQAAKRTNLPAAPSQKVSARKETIAITGIRSLASSSKLEIARKGNTVHSFTPKTTPVPLLESSRRLQVAPRRRIKKVKPNPRPRLKQKASLL